MGGMCLVLTLMVTGFQAAAHIFRLKPAIIIPPGVLDVIEDVGYFDVAELLCAWHRFCVHLTIYVNGVGYPMHQQAGQFIPMLDQIIRTSQGWYQRT